MSTQRASRWVSRRHLLRTAVTGTSALAVMSILQACGSSATSSPTAAPKTQNTAPTPKATTSTSNNASKAAAAPTATAAQAANASSSEKVTLTHWAHPLSKNDMTVFDPIIKQFQQKYPNTNVKIDLVPWTNRIQKVMSAVAANSAPDTSYVNVDEFTTYVAQGALAPLDPYIKASNVNLDDFVQGPRDAMGWNGKMYELPILYAFRVAYYNTEVWQQAGIDPSKSPTTWDEYSKMMGQLKDAKASGKIQSWPTWMAVLASNPVGNFNPWFYQAGGHFLTKDGKSGYDSEAGVTALTFMVKIFKNWCNPSDAADKGDDLVSLFGQQQYAYQNNYELSLIKQVHHDFPKTKFGVANTMKDKVRWTHGGVGAQCIFAESKYKQQTWDWINFLTSGQANLEYNLGFGYVPPRASLIAEFKKKVTDKTYLRALEEAKYGGIEKAPGLWDAWAIVAPMIQAALLGKMEPQVALKQASDKINSQVLSKYPGVAQG